MSDGRVVVTFLHATEMSSRFVLSLMDLRDNDHGRIARTIARPSHVNVASGRNALVERFLALDHEWLLTLDTDMVFGPDLVERLLAAADPVTRPIVGGLCFSHTDGELWPTLYQFVADEDAASGVQAVRCCEYPEGLFRVSATGAACMLIHRSVLEAIRDAEFDQVWPWYQETSYVNAMQTGEDITFCLRADRCGFPIYVDTRIKLGHVKPMLLDERMFEVDRAYRKSLGPDPDEITVTVREAS